MFSLPQRWLVLVILNAGYFFVYFHRTSPAVLAPHLLREFSASAASLGSMSAAYFYPYALMQPLVGYLADRFGPRKVVTASTAVGALGAVLFGTAPTLFFAALGRGLIGIGAAGVFLPALMALLPWFGPQAFARMNGILLATGNIAALTSAAPFSWVIEQTGWRVSFFFIAGAAILLAALSWIFVRDFPPGRGPEKTVPPREKPGLRTFLDVLKTPFFWMPAGLFFACVGAFQTFQGLWGVPFLIDLFSYEKLAAGKLVMLIAVGVIGGGPVLGYFADNASARQKIRLLSGLIGVQTGVWVLFVFFPLSLGAASLAALFFLLGAALAGTLSVLWALIREITGPERLGTVMGLMNPAPFLGVAIFQPVTGLLMDRAGKMDGGFPPSAYQNAFGLCLAAVAAAFLLSFFLAKRMKPL